MKIINKILFCYRITGDLSSFFRLVINSKKLSRSKSRAIPTDKINSFFPLNIRYKTISQTIFLRTYRGDIDMFYEIFHVGIYALPAAVKDVRLIIDLGANIGLSAIYFTAIFPEARIICVEPGEDNYRMLVKNLDIQIKTQQIETVKAAVSLTNGRVSFEDGKMHYNGKVIDGILNNTDAISLPTLLDNYKIDKVGLMKIDIEGSEKEILSGHLHWLKAVESIVIEMHSDLITDSCLAALNQNNFRTSQITNDPTNKYLYLATKV